MNTSEKSLIFAGVLLIIISAVLVGVTVNSNQSVKPIVDTGARVLKQNISGNNQVASSSQDKVGIYMKTLVNQAKDTDKIYLSDKCQPDILVAKMPPSGNMTFANKIQAPQELLIGNKSFILKANSEISIKVSDILPIKSIIPGSTSIRSYRCVGTNSPAVYIVVSLD